MPPVYEYFPFDNQPSYESQWRDMAQYWKSTGIIVEGQSMDVSVGNCAVSAGTGMSVLVDVGKAWIKGHMWKHTGTAATLAINSNTSGSTRTDLVVLRTDFVNNTMSYMVLQGTTIPVQNANIWDVPLANVAVPNNATDAINFTITDRRKFSTSHNLVPTIRRSGASFTLVHSASNFTTVNISSGADWMTDPNMYPGTDPTRIIITQNGFYDLYATATFGGAAGTFTGNPRRAMRIRINGTDVTALQQIYAPNTGVAVSSSSVERLFAGDYLQLEVFHDCGAGTTLTVSNTKLGVHFRDPISV